MDPLSALLSRTPIAVTLVEEDTYLALRKAVGAPEPAAPPDDDPLAQIAKALEGQLNAWAAAENAIDAGDFAQLLGQFYLPNGPNVAVAELFYALGLPTDSTKDALPIIVVNGLETSLTAEKLPSGCTLSHHPAEYDLDCLASGNLSRTPAKPGHSRAPGVIPGRRPHPVKPGATLYGVGVFRAVAAGTSRSSGAMSLTHGAEQKTLGISWYGPAFEYAVSADLTEYGDAKGFFDKTSQAKSVRHAEDGDLFISAALDLPFVATGGAKWLQFDPSFHRDDVVRKPGAWSDASGPGALVVVVGTK